MKHEETQTFFTVEDLTRSLAIVRIFETGRAAGSPSATAVLDDGAGISYGTMQFTHRSGSLASVLERYLACGGIIGRSVIEARLPLAKRRTADAIRSLAGDMEFRSALRAAGGTKEMRRAQTDEAFERYLRPAIAECRRLHLTQPLSLAVVLDSLTHGSFEKICSRVAAAGVGTNDERAWTTAYVETRDRWLGRVPRLRPTRYRTRFFLEQIRLSNWGLRPPLNVNGLLLAPEDGRRAAQAPADNEPPPEKATDPSDATDPAKEIRETPAKEPAPPAAQPVLDAIEEKVNSAAARYDQAERIAGTVTRRTDAAKSFWTAVGGSLWQAMWALIGLLAGIPREVWIVAAIVAGALALLYLYRQVALGMIREQKGN